MKKEKKVMSGKSNWAFMILALAAILLIAGGAMAQSRKGEVIQAARSSKAAVVAVQRGDRVEFAADKERMMSYVQKVVSQTSEGAVVKDIHIQTLEKSSFFAIQIEKQGTVFLGLTPSDGGIKGKFAIGPDIVQCVGGCGCKLSWQYDGTHPEPQLVCGCSFNENPSSDPQSGGECHMEPVRKYIQLGVRLNDLLVAEKFELTDGPPKAVEATPAIKVTQRKQ